jgi:hypothetical protein
MMKKFVLRSQLQVDASPELKRILKQIAAREEKTLKEVVLGSLAQTYPELKLFVKSNLEPFQQ